MKVGSHDKPCSFQPIEQVASAKYQPRLLSGSRPLRRRCTSRPTSPLSPRFRFCHVPAGSCQRKRRGTKRRKQSTSDFAVTAATAIAGVVCEPEHFPLSF